MAVRGVGRPSRKKSFIMYYISCKKVVWTGMAVRGRPSRKNPTFVMYFIMFHAIKWYGPGWL